MLWEGSIDIMCWNYSSRQPMRTLPIREAISSLTQDARILDIPQQLEGECMLCCWGYKRDISTNGDYRRVGCLLPGFNANGACEIRKVANAFCILLTANLCMMVWRCAAMMISLWIASGCGVPANKVLILKDSPLLRGWLFLVHVSLKSPDGIRRIAPGQLACV